jgi:glycosyltransferase involved in cell wall biosynthesis
VIVGGGPYSAQEQTAIGDSGFADRIVKLTPTDAEIPEVYRRAAAFLFPSIYEGFGLPTLEALSEGTPTILADASCSREVGGGAALYFPPGDVDALVARIREAMSAEGARSAQLDGPARGREFGWDSVAQMTADLYRAVARKE